MSYCQLQGQLQELMGGCLKNVIKFQNQCIFYGETCNYLANLFVNTIDVLHGVNRVLCFFSSRPNFDPPLPHLQPRVPPPPFGSGGRDTLACGRGVGGSQLGQWDRHCGTLGICVLCDVMFICTLLRSYDAILGVVSHDWVHQLGEEAAQAGIKPTTKEEVLRFIHIFEIILLPFPFNQTYM